MRPALLLTALLVACQPSPPPEAPKKAPEKKAPEKKAPEAKTSPKTPEAPKRPRVLRLNFNELATTAYARETMAPGPEAQVDALWNAAFHLRGWNILGDPKSTRNPPDLIFEERKGKRWLMAFTDNKRLHDYASKAGKLDARGTSVFITTPNPQLLGLLKAMKARGVHGVWFNEGPFAWAASIDEILASHARLKASGDVR